ncbi:MAG: MFS transporter [Hyphomicrobiales bacterium]
MRSLKWVVLILTGVTYLALTLYSDYFDSLKEVLTSHLNFDSTDYGIFQSAYSFPNVFLAMTIFGGIAVDKLGIRLSGSISVILTLFGALVASYATDSYFLNGGFLYHFLNSFLKNFSPALKLMSIGFFFVGLGLENANLIITKIIVRWFEGSEMALAISINISLARLGTAIAISLAPYFITIFGFSMGIWLGFWMVVIGVITFFIYVLIETRRVKKERALRLNQKEEVKVDTKPEEDETFRWRDVKKMLKNPSFIYITLLCLTFYSAFIPFLKYAPDLLHNKFHFSLTQSGLFTSALPIGTIIFGPLFALFVDYKGKAVSLMILGAILMILAYLFLGLTNFSPVVSFVCLGAAFSLVPAAMWPSVARISPLKTLGTAYGVIFFIQNFGLWLFSFLPGYILDVTNPGVTPKLIASGKAFYNYTWTILILLLLGVLGLIFALLLYRTNKKNKHGLNKPIEVQGS